MSCSQAIKSWEGKNNQKAEEAEVVKLCFQVPPLTKMDGSLGSLKMCEQLSLSTNSIDRIGSLGGMSRLRILSLGRNNIKKIEKLDEVAGTLEQLWISYNQISSLDGLSSLQGLKVLYCSNNCIKSFSELEKIASLQNLRDVLFVGNPMYDEVPGRKEARIEILKRLPNLTKIDGEMVKMAEKEEASQSNDA